MKAIVVYESHWGNTAAIARAIAEGSAESPFDWRAVRTGLAVAGGLAGAARDHQRHRVYQGIAADPAFRQ